MQIPQPPFPSVDDLEPVPLLPATLEHPHEDRCVSAVLAVLRLVEFREERPDRHTGIVLVCEIREFRSQRHALTFRLLGRDPPKLRQRNALVGLLAPRRQRPPVDVRRPPVIVALVVEHDPRRPHRLRDLDRLHPPRLEDLAHARTVVEIQPKETRQVFELRRVVSRAGVRVHVGRIEPQHTVRVDDRVDVLPAVRLEPHDAFTELGELRPVNPLTVLPHVVHARPRQRPLIEPRDLLLPYALERKAVREREADQMAILSESRMLPGGDHQRRNHAEHRNQPSHV